MTSRRGFTLVEIMVVVAILMTLATLVISSVLRARHNANEMAGVAACKTIVTACQTYYANTLPHSYPNSLSDLILPQSDPPYIDNVLATGTKQGYRFTYLMVDPESFTLNADPLLKFRKPMDTPSPTMAMYPLLSETSVVVGKTGTRHFFCR